MDQYDIPTDNLHNLGCPPLFTDVDPISLTELQNVQKILIKFEQLYYGSINEITHQYNGVNLRPNHFATFHYSWTTGSQVFKFKVKRWVVEVIYYGILSPYWDDYHYKVNLRMGINFRGHCDDYNCINLNEHPVRFTSSTENFYHIEYPIIPNGLIHEKLNGRINKLIKNRDERILALNTPAQLLKKSYDEIDDKLVHDFERGIDLELLRKI